VRDVSCRCTCTAAAAAASDTCPNQLTKRPHFLKPGDCVLMPYSILESVVIVEAFICTGSFVKTKNLFLEKIPGRSVSGKSTMQELIEIWRRTGSVQNAPRNRPPSVCTPELKRQVQSIMASSPRKSTRKLHQQVPASERTCRRVLKVLKLKPYRISVVQQLIEPDLQKRVHFCSWLLRNVASGFLNPLMLIMSDEA